MSEEIDKLLKESTGILMAIDELHNELPKVQKTKAEIDKNIQEFQNSFKVVKEIIEKNAKSMVLQKDELKKISEDAIKNILNIQKQINYSLDKYGNVDEYISEIELRIEKLEEIQKKIISEIKKLQGINKDKNLDNSINIDIVLDYIHPRTIQYLYEKYKNTNIPIIVRKAVPSETSPKVWSANYCFYVEKIEGYNAIGSYYEFGKKKTKKDNKAPAINVPSYVLHGNKDEVDAIIKTVEV